MRQEQFFEFCYREYVRLEGQSHQVYLRGGFVVTALAAITAGVVSVGRLDALLMPGRTAAAIYILTGVGWAAASGLSLWHLACSVLMRKYQRLSLADITKFRQDCFSEEDRTPDRDPDPDSERYVFAGIAKRLSEANEHNDELNQARFRHLDRSLRCLVIAVGFAAVHVAALLLLNLLWGIPDAR